MEDKIQIKNRHGLQLACILHQPQGDGPFPAVIMLHGFTGYKEEENNEVLSHQLVAHGYVVMRFDASGFGESEGTLEHDYRFSNYYADLEVVFGHLKSLPFVDPERIALWGHSMGAMMGVIFAAEHPQFKAVCAVSPPAQMGTVDELGKRVERWRETGWFEKESSLRGLIRIPYAFIEDAQQWNVLDYIGKVRCPTLLILGTDDIHVLPDDTRRIYKAAGESIELWEVEGMDHEYKKYPQLIEKVNERVVEFFKLHL